MDKRHETVVRSAFSSQNVKDMGGTGHLWKLGCAKMARRSGAKDVFKSQCTKHTSAGAL